MNKHDIHCMRCKSVTPTHSHQLARTINGRPLLYGKCKHCNGGKTKFLSKSEFQSSQKGEGILGNLLGLPGGKVPILSSLPLIGALF
jgi:hypothetical protein